MGGCAGGVFADLGPYKFCRIEFWGTGWKLIHMHARMARQKLFHLAAAVDRMLIPHHHHRSCDVTQQMHEKPDHLLPADRVTVGLQMQLDLAFPWTHAQSANQVGLDPTVVSPAAIWPLALARCVIGYRSYRNDYRLRTGRGCTATFYILPLRRRRNIYRNHRNFLILSVETFNKRAFVKAWQARNVLPPFHRNLAFPPFGGWWQTVGSTPYRDECSLGLDLRGLLCGWVRR